MWVSGSPLTWACSRRFSNRFVASNQLLGQRNQAILSYIRWGCFCVLLGKPRSSGHAFTASCHVEQGCRRVFSKGDPLSKDGRYSVTHPRGYTLWPNRYSLIKLMYPQLSVVRGVLNNLSFPRERTAQVLLTR